MRISTGLSAGTCQTEWYTCKSANLKANSPGGHFNKAGAKAGEAGCNRKYDTCCRRGADATCPPHGMGYSPSPVRIGAQRA
jgi:hypothetical protein